MCDFVVPARPDQLREGQFVLINRGSDQFRAHLTRVDLHDRPDGVWAHFHFVTESGLTGTALAIPNGMGVRDVFVLRQPKEAQ